MTARPSLGRIGKADRAGGPIGPEPATQSQPEALIPCANCDRLKAERLKLDRRIHNQRMALRVDWKIVEMRSDFALRLKVPSRMLEHAIKQNRVINELRAALNARVVSEKGENYRVVRVVKLGHKPMAVER